MIATGSIWIDTGVCVRLVVTFGHFLWQASAIALLAWLVARMLRQAGSGVRYWVLVGAMAAIVACPIATFMLVGDIAGVAVTGGRDVSGHQVGAADIAGAADANGVGVATDAFDTAADGSADGSSLAAPATAVVVATDQASARANRAAVGIGEEEIDAAGSAQWWQLRNLSPYLAGAYVLGVFAMFVRVLIGLRGGSRLRNASTLVSDAGVMAMLRSRADAVGLKTLPMLAYCERIMVPTVVGIVRPAILLPASLASGLPAEQIAAVLAHELAHIARHDVLVNVLQRFVESILFFHPAVWLVSRWIRSEREHCCDEIAVAGGADRMSYAESLLMVAQACTVRASQGSAASLMSVHAMDKPSSLRRRIVRLVGAEAREDSRLVRNWPMAGAMMAAVLVMAGLLVNIDAVPAEAAAEPAGPLTFGEKVTRMLEEHGDEISGSIQEDKASKVLVSGTIRTFDNKKIDWRKAYLSLFSQTEKHNSIIGWSFLGKEFSLRVPPGAIWGLVKYEGYASYAIGPFWGAPGDRLEKMDIVLQSISSAIVRITDDRGNPVEGASIEIASCVRSLSTAKELKTTDKDGVVRFAAIDDMEYGMDVLAAGYEWVKTEKKAWFRGGKECVVQLKRALPTSGVMTDEQGNPVAGASLRFYESRKGKHRESAGLAWGSNRFSVSGRELCKTDNDGRFVLSSLRRDTDYILAVKTREDHWQLVKNIRAGESGMKLKLLPELTLAGEITGNVEAFLRKHEKLKLGLRRENHTWWGRYSELQKVDGKWRFEFRKLFRIDSYRFEQRPNSIKFKLPHSIADMKLHVDDNGKLSIVNPKRVVILRFRTPDGKPVKELMVWACSAESGTIERGKVNMATFQGSAKLTSADIKDGQVVLRERTDTSLWFGPQKEGEVTFSKSKIDRIPPGTKPLVVDVIVTPTAVGQADKSLPNASAKPVVPAKISTTRPAVPLTFDEKLSRMREEHKGEISSSTLKDEAREVHVSGTIRTSDNKSIDILKIRLTLRSEMPPYLYWAYTSISWRGTATRSYIAPTRDFRMSFHPGIIWGVVAYEGYAPQVIGPLWGAPGQRLEGISVVLNRRLSDTVRIMDDGGKPVAGASVGFLVGGGNRLIRLESMTADKDGAVKFAAIDDMEHVIYVNAPGFEWTRTESKPWLRNGKECALQLKRALPTTGVVTDSQGKPVVGASLSFFQSRDKAGKLNYDYGLTGFDHMNAKGTKELCKTDNDGHFVLNTLRADTKYMLELKTRDGNLHLLKNVSAGVSGMKVKLRPELRLAGEITGNVEALLRKSKTIALFEITRSFSLWGPPRTTQRNRLTSKIRKVDGKWRFEFRNVLRTDSYVLGRYGGIKLRLAGSIADMRLYADDNGNLSMAKAQRTVIMRFRTPDGKKPKWVTMWRYTARTDADRKRMRREMARSFRRPAGAMLADIKSAQTLHDEPIGTCAWFGPAAGKNYTFSKTNTGPIMPGTKPLVIDVIVTPKNGGLVGGRGEVF